MEQAQQTRSIGSQAVSVESRFLAFPSGFLGARVNLGFPFCECLSPAGLLAQLLIAEVFLTHSRFCQESFHRCNTYYSHHFRSSFVIQRLPVSSPRLKTILSRATEISSTL